MLEGRTNKYYQERANRLWGNAANWIIEPLQSRNWDEDIIGQAIVIYSSCAVLRTLCKDVILQNGLFSKGRVEIFMMLPAIEYVVSLHLCISSPHMSIVCEFLSFTFINIENDVRPRYSVLLLPGQKCTFPNTIWAWISAESRSTCICSLAIDADDGRIASWGQFDCFHIITKCSNTNVWMWLTIYRICHWKAIIFIWRVWFREATCCLSARKWSYFLFIISCVNVLRSVRIGLFRNWSKFIEELKTFRSNHLLEIFKQKMDFRMRCETHLQATIDHTSETSASVSRSTEMVTAKHGIVGGWSFASDSHIHRKRRTDTGTNFHTVSLVQKLARIQDMRFCRRSGAILLDTQWSRRRRDE